LLEVRKLSASYGKLNVLEDVSLEVGEGEFVVVVGPNGAGKTTLLKAIMGLVPARGDVRLRGRDLLSEPAHRRVRLGVGYVPEGRHVFATLTVEENLRLVARDGDAAGGLGRIYELFPRLRERRRQPAGTLSGGEQQMLAMGRALVADPALLIADEVSLGLAPIVVGQMFEVMTEMYREGRTILLAEQNARLSLEAATRAYVLEAGRVALAGPASELREDPRVVEAYISSF